jgi:LacI family transcriptional regulator
VASLSDISRHAGVSIATCSRVLNGSAHPVSDATRERVMQAAQELGYAPSALARALVTRSSRIIGVIVGDIVDPYFAEIARGVEAVGADLGYLTMVCSAELGTEAELAHLQQLRDYQAAGIIFAGSGRVRDPSTHDLAQAVSDARERGSVVVALAQREFDAHSIVFDNEAAAHDITASAPAGAIASTAASATRTASRPPTGCWPVSACPRRSWRPTTRPRSAS